MFERLHDPKMPMLASIRQTDLERISGHAGTRLLRLRYQPGAHAILHVALSPEDNAPQGTIWVYAGSKATGLARRHPDARLDTASGALFQAFPHDHRLPQLAHFVARAKGFAPRLIGGPARDAPTLIRYRPGLSATFRWTRADGQVFFVKHSIETSVSAQALALASLDDAARGRGVCFAPLAGLVPELDLIAYSCAPGVPLATGLTGAAVAQVLKALTVLWSLPMAPGRVLDRMTLVGRAGRAQRMIALFDPDAGRRAADLVASLQSRDDPGRMRPIHGDMKPEHAFLSGCKTTLIDMEDLSLGDPDHDLATLEARLILAQVTGQAATADTEAARRQIRSLAGPAYLWFLACARLQCARFFAQRLDPATIPILRQVLADC